MWNKKEKSITMMELNTDARHLTLVSLSALLFISLHHLFSPSPSALSPSLCPLSSLSLPLHFPFIGGCSLDTWKMYSQFKCKTAWIIWMLEFYIINLSGVCCRFAWSRGATSCHGSLRCQAGMTCHTGFLQFWRLTVTLFFTCQPLLRHGLCSISIIWITYPLSFLFLVLHHSLWITWSTLSPLGYSSGVSFAGLSSACRCSLPHLVTALFSLMEFTDYIPVWLSVSVSEISTYFHLSEFSSTSILVWHSHSSLNSQTSVTCRAWHWRA